MDANQEPAGSETDTNSLSNKASNYTKGMTEQLVSALERVAVIANKGVVITMLSLGSVMILFAMASVSVRVTNNGITTGEFVCLVVTGAFIIIGAGLLKVIIFKMSNSGEIIKAQQKTAEKVINDVVGAAITKFTTDPTQGF